MSQRDAPSAEPLQKDKEAAQDSTGTGKCIPQHVHFAEGKLKFHLCLRKINLFIAKIAICKKSKVA